MRDAFHLSPLVGALMFVYPRQGISSVHRMHWVSNRIRSLLSVRSGPGSAAKLQAAKNFFVPRRATHDGVVTSTPPSVPTAREIPCKNPNTPISRPYLPFPIPNHLTQQDVSFSRLCRLDTSRHHQQTSHSLHGLFPMNCVQFRGVHTHNCNSMRSC